MNKSPLVMTNVCKGFGNADNRIEILTSVSLTLLEGELTMLLGPSGTGKSTILHLIAGLTPVDKGSIEVCGVNIEKCTTNQILRLRREKIGFVFQDFRLLHGLTAIENVIVPLYALGKSKRAARKKAMELLDLMGLSNRINHYPRQLSGGEQQRVGIARALANDPKVILADEPTGNLDQKLASGVVEIISTLPNKLGTTVLMVTHNNLLTRYATKVIKLQDGSIEEVNNVQISH